MMVKTLKRVQSFTYPEAREASERRVKCAAVAAEQLLNCFVLLWRKLCWCFTHLFPLYADPPLQYLFLRHDHCIYIYKKRRIFNLEKVTLNVFNSWSNRNNYTMSMCIQIRGTIGAVTRDTFYKYIGGKKAVYSHPDVVTYSLFASRWPDIYEGGRLDTTAGCF